MRTTDLLTTLSLVLLLTACGRQDGSQQDPTLNDSLSKLRQKKSSDSLKSKNPLLILPPDSEYTGDYVDRYPGGVIKFRGQFRFGERHGQWFSFYPNGEMWSEMHFDKGIRQGLNITYFENGKKRYEGYYRNDMKDSAWKYYDTAGNLAASVWYKKDRIVKEIRPE